MAGCGEQGGLAPRWWGPVCNVLGRLGACWVLVLGAQLLVIKASAQAAPPVAARGRADAFTWLPDGIAAAEVARALQRYRDEPPVAWVVREALSHIQEEQDHLARASRRARWRGWVPRLGATLRHGQALDWAGTEQADASTRQRVSADQQLSLSVSLVFDLPRLVFTEQETSVARAQRSLQRDAQALAAEVIATYFERRKLQVQRDLGVRTALEVELRILELQALLDSWTRGGFSSRLRVLRRSTSNGP